MSNKTALIIGATGLTGEQCVKLLVAHDNYNKVIAITRSKLSFKNPKLENLIVDFDHLENYKAGLKADDVYCAIGTTIKKAGSKEAFRHVDFEIPLQIAKIAIANGAKQFALVSSLGADSKSGVFYSKVKGELEDALKKLNYNSLIILRPSILLGDRKEKRTGEEVGRFVAEKLSFIFSGPLKKYKGTPVTTLAKAMLNACLENKKGVRIIENEDIFVLAEK